MRALDITTANSVRALHIRASHSVSQQWTSQITSDEVCIGVLLSCPFVARIVDITAATSNSVRAVDISSLQTHAFSILKLVQENMGSEASYSSLGRESYFGADGIKGPERAAHSASVLTLHCCESYFGADGIKGPERAPHLCCTAEPVCL